MKYRQIETKFWHDPYISCLEMDEKLLFMYFLTNEFVNLPGIYELTDRTICHVLDPKLSPTLDIKKIKEKFEKDRKFRFYKDWVYIVNFHKYNQYSSAKPILNSFMTEYEKIPDEVLFHFFDSADFFYTPPIKNYKDFFTINTVIVKDNDKDKDKKGKPYPRPYPRIRLNMSEHIDPDTVPNL